ncbi:MAG: sulfite exporter TauE/SafE family protein [Desulfatiglandaceae bacterium]
MNRKKFLMWTFVLLLLSVMSLAFAQSPSSDLTTPQMSEKMKNAINKSLENEEFAEKTKAVIKAGEEPGYLGIPGAPSPNLILGLLWAIWVGWLFSTIGAFGGMMAGIGHITVFGLGPYGQSFGRGNPVNKLVVDSIRVSNQWLVGFSGLVSSINYYKMGRLVLPIALCLGIGGIAGSWLIPEITAGKISFREYVGYFGLIVMVLGFFLLYEITPTGSARKKEAKAAAQAFEKSIKEKKDSAEMGVKLVEGNQKFMWIGIALVLASGLWINLIGSPKIVAYLLAIAGLIMGFMIGTVRFTFYGVEFKFKAYLPVLGGIVIAAVAAFLGIGGGFLFVPFMTSVVGLPMFIVAGTSTLCVFIGMIVSIFTYMVGKGILVSWGFIGMELIGIFIGSMIGPRTSKYLPDKALKILFILLAFYVGIRYASQGFFGQKWLP